jgi:NAD+ diphosphatase
MQEPFPRIADIQPKVQPFYLFTIGNIRCFMCTDEDVTAPEGYSYASVRQLRRAEGAEKLHIFALFTAYHLFKWYSTSRFCGGCGAQTVPDDRERAMRCPACGNIIYPRINPAVIVGVTNGDKLLLTRYARGRGVTFDALVAGFTEIGEALEQTVEREVMEEVGLRVKNIRYYKSQPWGLSGGILAGYFCDVDGSDTVTLDESELSAAVWTKRGDITGQPDDMSLTNEMMLVFRDGKV